MANNLTLAQLEAKIIRVRARWRYAQARAASARKKSTKEKYEKLANARLGMLIDLKKDAKKLRALKKQPAKSFKISDKGVDLIKSYEGFFPEPYNDPVGYATIGYGHLIGYRNVTSADKKKWGKLTKAEATELLKGDLKEYENYVKQYVKVPLTQNMFDALVSFVYNVGPGGISGSTLGRELNKGHYNTAANELLKWDKAGGRALPGLTRRRKEERELFLTK